MNIIKFDKPANIHADHRLRIKKKFLENGLDAFADHEILELLLFYSIPQADTNPIAHKLINKFHSMSAIFGAPIDSLMEVDGIGEHTATLLKLIPSIWKESSRRFSYNGIIISNVKSTKAFVKTLFDGSDKEDFFIICVGTKNEILDVKKISSGTYSKVEVPIRSVTNYIFKQNCERIVIAHNHPQGKSLPSVEDISLTQKLFNSCVLNDIDILDHIIVSKDDEYSFAQNGEMDLIKQGVLKLLKYSEQSVAYQKFCASTDTYLLK